MTARDELIITSDDIELLTSLKNWLVEELDVKACESTSESQSKSLGELTSKIAVVLKFLESNYKKLITLLKSWAANNSKDFELHFEYGEKKATVKCPANRLNDEQINEAFSVLDDFFVN